MTKFPWVSSYSSRHGKRYFRFRRKGYAPHTFGAPFGTKEFEIEYADCLARKPAPVGQHRIVPGSVSDVVARYYADNAFQDLSPSTQVVYRGVLERFRSSFGGDPIRAFDAGRIARLMTRMRDRPHAAARLRKLLAQLLVVARRDRLVPSGFRPIEDTKAPKVESEGYHRWTEEELATFEAKHPLGTKPRLAFALLLWGAQRSGDVRFMTATTIAEGRIRLDQSKTSNAVDVPVMPELEVALAAGPVGERTLVEARTGEPFTAKGFYNLIKRACIRAGLPHCSAHGLRKAAARRCYLSGCTDPEGMQITGHKTVREYHRYAGVTGARPDLADAARDKILANRPSRLANDSSQLVQKAEEPE